MGEKKKNTADQRKQGGPKKAVPKKVEGGGGCCSAAGSCSSKKEVAKKEVVAKGNHTSAHYKQLGVKAFLAKKYLAASEHFTNAIELDPKNGKLYSNRSACYSFLKMYQESLNDANKTIEYEKEWYKGYYRKGNAAEKLLLYPEAYTAYTAGLKIKPDDLPLQQAKKRSFSFAR